MPDVWAVSKSGWLVLRNIPVVITSTSVNYGLGIAITAAGLQGGGWNSDNRDSATNETYNPFTVAKTNGYVDAGVWNASNILSGSYYTNIQGFVRVNPKSLTISGVVANSVYDGTTSATLKGNVAKNGLVGLTGSQTLDVVYTSAAFQDKDAGNNKTVDITYTVADGANGGKLSNYILPTTTTANITPKPVSVVIVGNDKIYDGTTAATVNGQFSGVVAGDSLALAYASAYFDSKNAGNRNVTATGLSLTGADGGNYTLSGQTSAATTAAITRRPLQLFGFADEGGATRIGAANLTATNIAEGDAVTLGGSVGIAVTAAGNQPITDFSSLTVDNPNYTAVGSVGSIIVGGANLVFDRVAEGGASVTTSGKTTTVTQTTDKAVLDWMRLSLGKDETLTFNQPSASSIVLNRVVTDLPSVIEGTLRANGRVFILNAGGVLFTANSHVSAGALVASTFNLTNDDFLKSNYVFTVARGTGSIIAEGDIIIADGGFVALASNHDIKHTGTVNGGDAALFASTDSLTLNPEGRAVSPKPPLYAIGNLTGATTVGGRINIGSATKGGELLTAGDTVTVSGLNLSTGTSGAWDWRQNGDVAIGAGQFAGNFVNDNLNLRSLSLVSRNGDIDVNNAIDWSANTTLTLGAGRDININKSIKATGATAGLVMDYGGDYHLITPATFSGAVLDSTGKPVARTIPAGTEFTDIALSGANAKLNINGDDYTLIRNMDELAALSSSHADATGTATGHFALTQDLDAAAWSAAHTGTPSVVASLSGTLAGLGHKVDNLTLDAPTENNVGLVGQVAANEATANILRDLGVTNAAVTGRQYVGALAGNVADNVSVYQVYSTGKVSARNFAGGLVGRMSGTGIYGEYETYENGRYMEGSAPRLDSSYSSAYVASGAGTGGLVGSAHTITIVNSHAAGDINGSHGVYYVNRETGEKISTYDEFGHPVAPPVWNDYYIGLEWVSGVGGLLGSATYANVDRSYAVGDVTAIDGEQIGGLIGAIRGQWSPEPFPSAVTNSFATGDVTGGDSVGGLIGETGQLILNIHYPVTVDNVYATGNVTGTRETDSILGGGMIGGLIGSAIRSNISNSWATGNVITIADGRTNYMGGLVGNQNEGSISNSYATGTVVGNGGRSTGGLVGNSSAGTSISDSYYQDASAAAAAETAPIRTETGGIMDDLRLNEPGNTRQGNSGNAATARDRNRSALAQYIYQDDEDGYSVRVKAISVEGAECLDDDEDCN
jgi:filamentous hemagglutinin family protein